MEYCSICGFPLNENLFCPDPECIETRLVEYNKFENIKERIDKLKEENDKTFNLLIAKLHNDESNK